MNTPARLHELEDIVMPELLLDNAIGILFSYEQCRHLTHRRDKNLSVPYVMNPM